MTDQELIQGFLKGGKQEYKQVVSWITEVVRSKLWAERVTSDDVIADTTMKLLLNLREDSFRIESSVKTYVQRIALYTLVDASRREKKFNSDPVDDDFAATDTANPHEKLEHDEEAEIFERIVGMMPEKCRHLWEMAFGDKLECKEIGNKLGMSEGAVRTTLSRCKDRASELYKKLT